MSNPHKAPSGPWTPPQDPEKPNCPYVPNFTVEIKAHIPPPPFGCRDYGRGERQKVSIESLKSATQTEHVLNHPPLQTASLPNPNAAQLTITKSLAIGNSRGAQLAVCSIAPKTSSATPFKAVAKIFDPLYYSFSDKLVSVPVDTVRMADQDYSREAVAYEHLRKVDHTGSFTAKYFGSWTFTLSIIHANKKHLRPVRLVLIEYLDGSSIRDLYVQNKPGPNADLDALHFDKEYRLGVLAKVLDGIVKQRHAGLDQRDLAPRNVILVPPPYEKPVPGKPMPLPRVVLVDYNNSIVYEKTIHGKPKFMASKLPCNPMQSYWTESLPEFAGWIPPEWYGNPKHRREWLHHQFGESREYATPQLANA
jgi:hypothetical protein